MCHARKERVLLFGTRSADHIRASSHSGCIQRPNTWLHPIASLRHPIFPLHRGRRPYMALRDISRHRSKWSLSGVKRTWTERSANGKRRRGISARAPVAPYGSRRTQSGHLAHGPKNKKSGYEDRGHFCAGVSAMLFRAASPTATDTLLLRLFAASGCGCKRGCERAGAARAGSRIVERRPALPGPGQMRTRKRPS